MEVNLKRFVDINIERKESYDLISTRDTSALLVGGALTGDESLGSGHVFKSYKEVEDEYGEDESALKDPLLNYANAYFNVWKCKKLAIYFDATKLDPTVPSTVAQFIYENVRNEHILVSHLTATYVQMKNIAKAYKDYEVENEKVVYGINDKLFIVHTDFTADVIADDSKKDYSHLLVKCYRNTLPAETPAISTIIPEISFIKYLSNIDFYKNDSVKDYYYTEEKELDYEDFAPSLFIASDADMSIIKTSEFNSDMKLAGEMRNVGGNTKGGLDLVNEYTLIVLHQLLTNRLIQLLTEKIKGQTGISAIYSAISTELNRFVINGYLDTTKIYNKETLVVEKENGIKYTIIEKGTPLNLGYYVSILPLSSLSEEQKSNHSAPDIYIVLAESKGIRTITIKGEVVE